MIKIIVAMSNNGVIGVNNSIPWHVPADMKRFKQVTSGHVVIMGRNTWESIPERFRPLSGRENIVLSRSKTGSYPEGVEVFDSLPAALESKAGTDKDIFIIGGGQVYLEGLDYAQELDITVIPDSELLKREGGVTCFPYVSPLKWECLGSVQMKETHITHVSYKRLEEPRPGLWTPYHS